MPVYRLRPVKGQEDSEHWHMSSIGATTCWVDAANEKDARKKVHATTYEGAERDGPKWRDTLHPPWSDAKLSECVEDQDMAVETGFIHVDGGKRLPIRDFCAP